MDGYMSAIADVEPYLLYGGGEDPAPWSSAVLLVKVVTKDGRTGWGETLTSIRAGAVAYMVKVLAKVMKGRDVHNVESNRALWYKLDFNHAISLESVAALSAFDMASWDIIGRELGAPLHMFFGGLTRDRVLVYANGWYGGCRDPACFAEKAKDVVKKGYTALKFDPFGDSFDHIDESSLRRATEIVRAVREAVGDDVDILIECHGRFNAESAVRIAQALRPYRVYFFEEPVHPEDIEGLAKFKAAVDAPVALGERIINKGQLLQYIRYVDYLQIDLGRFGGPTEARKAAAMAEAYGVLMAFHNANGPVLHAATIQLDAAIPNFALQESFYDFWPQWKRDLIGGSMPVEGGYVSVPRRPGIGVDVNEKVVERYKAEPGEVEIRGEPHWVVKGTW